MSLYNESTQFKNWIFTNDQLKQLREECNNEQRKQIIEKTPSSESNLLSPEEELHLILYYLSKTIEYGNALNLNEKISATAIIYIKRFYLKNSVMKYSPKLVMFTCLFIACKTEDNHIDIDYYSQNVIKSPPSDILNLEVIILESLKFNLIVYHPFRPIYGFILDISDNINLYNNSQPIKFDTLYESSKKSIQKTLFSDLSFNYHPSIIALACLSLNFDNFNLFFDNKFKDKDEDYLKDLKNKINQVIQVINGIPDKPDIEVVKKIDRKLIFLNNPEKEKRKSKKDSNKNPKKKSKPTESNTSTTNNDNTTTAAVQSTTNNDNTTTSVPSTNNDNTTTDQVMKDVNIVTNSTV